MEEARQDEEQRRSEQEKQHHSQGEEEHRRLRGGARGEERSRQATLTLAAPTERKADGACRAPCVSRCAGGGSVESVCRRRGMGCMLQLRVTVRSHTHSHSAVLGWS